MQERIGIKGSVVNHIQKAFLGPHAFGNAASCEENSRKSFWSLISFERIEELYRAICEKLGFCTEKEEEPDVEEENKEESEVKKEDKEESKEEKEEQKKPEKEETLPDSEKTEETKEPAVKEPEKETEDE